MSTSTKLILSVLVFTGASAVQAANHAAARIQALRDAKSRVTARAEATKGGPRGSLLLERNRLDGLIQDLEAGKAVDPSEIDRALERAERAPL